MSTKNPYTKIEVVEERHPKQPEDSPLVKVSHVLVNGHQSESRKTAYSSTTGTTNATGKTWSE